MKKLFNRSGFSLIEMMATLVILVVLVVAMGTGMTSGMKIYKDATFEADSGSMSGIVNTSLGDILRYSENVRINEGTISNPSAGFVDSDGAFITRESVGFVFTNYEYGVQNAYFHLSQGGDEEGILQIRSLNNAREPELVNTGAYPDLMITDFEIIYVPRGLDSEGSPGRGGYFLINYVITSRSDASKTREVETVVRLMNVST